MSAFLGKAIEAVCETVSRSKARWSIASFQNGFILLKNDVEVDRVAFPRVREIFAYKRDLYTYDLICLGFRFTHREGWVVVDEAMPGFKELVRRIEVRFGVETESWYLNVAIPAFASNFTTLWTAGGAAADGLTPRAA